MNVFVDECVSKKLMPYMTVHNYDHATDTPLRSTKNSTLLRALAPDYDVFLTTDRNIPFQQNLKNFSLAVVIMRGFSNDIADLLPLVPNTLAILDRIARVPIQPGDLYEVMPT